MAKLECHVTRLGAAWHGATGRGEKVSVPIVNISCEFLVVVRTTQT
jgi:hypothetical protein